MPSSIFANWESATAVENAKKKKKKVEERGVRVKVIEAEENSMILSGRS